MAISINGLGDLGKYNSRPLITYEGIIRFIKPYLRDTFAYEEIESDFTFNIEYITFQVYFD